jgi:phosphoesterase RecJ-like protein
MALAANDCRWARRVLDGASRVLCVTHTRPDGDAVGSLLGMQALLRGMGLHVTAVLSDPPGPRYNWLMSDDPPSIWERDADRARQQSFDAVVIVDTCAVRQLEPLMSFIDSLQVPRIVFDHHATRDVVADVLLVDETAAAATQLVYEWAKAVNLPVGEKAATLLFAGLATDTGWFRFSSVDVRCLGVAEALVLAGAKPSEIYERLYNQEPERRLRLLGAMLETLQVRAGGRLAVVQLDQAAFKKCGAGPGDTEEMVNEPQRIAGVDAALLFVEQDDGKIRISLRSKGAIDVAAIASKYGGGGHRQAAGARLDGPLTVVRARVVDDVEKALGR